MMLGLQLVELAHTVDKAYDQRLLPPAVHFRSYWSLCWAWVCCVHLQGMCVSAFSAAPGLIVGPVHHRGFLGLLASWQAWCAVVWLLKAAEPARLSLGPGCLKQRTSSTALWCRAVRHTRLLC